MINILCVTCLFNFFIIFSNKTDGQIFDTKTRVYLFFWDGRSMYTDRTYLKQVIVIIVAN